MAILEEEKSCMVPTITESTLKTPMLSTMQVKKGLKRKEVTYLATLKEERDDGLREPMPKEIEGVLDEFKDVMSPELPKRLPPRREEDHKIELEPGAKPPIMGPYRMAPPELEELRRQLKELLDRGVHPTIQGSLWRAGSVLEEAQWVLIDVHRLPGTQQGDGKEQVSYSAHR
ncbi:hypothetical protein CK203_064181 [Vitis vinifera]|uniref:Uncharacterized protein n=1 Tax=Vitis vinifera TaxID=29760 RepID=A0A438FR37_VITVI|nr:hypothetical protein CK203_064181 [Vitis vinifera]